MLKKLITSMAAAVALTVPLKAEEFYTMSTLGPGSSPYMVMSTFAQIVEKRVPDVKFQVNATGAATQHALEAGAGKIDFYMWSASVHQFMKTGEAMFKEIPQAPELSQHVRGVFSFPLGLYHIITYADSGIEKLEDLKGKKVFLGPPGGGATAIMQSVVEGATGLKPGEDFEQVNLGWDAASQAFQDGRIDVYVNSTIAPSPVVEQIALSNEIRFLGLTEEQMQKEPVQKILNRPGGFVADLDPAVYGENVVNTEPVHTLGSNVGVAAYEGVDEDHMYEITKAWWEGAQEMQDSAPWLRSISLENALKDFNLPLHPGALRYYEEVGLEIPADLIPPAN